MESLFQFELNELKDPNYFTDPITIKGEDTEWLKHSLEMMTLIRKSEEKLGDMIIAGKIVCPCHLAIGQEAISVGLAKSLRPSDRGYGNHRSHGHYLSAGGKVFELFAEVLGRSEGCSKGMGGSMHLYTSDTSFRGSVPIVAGTVPIAVGAALAAMLDKPDKKDMDVGVAYFGDGAIEEGVVHESMNLAAVFKMPAIFICENNLFSSHLHIRLRQPADRVARFAESHRMNVRVVDGNDVVSVAKACHELIDAARNGEGPGFLEAVTYRWRGHVGPSEDIDVGLKRGDELKAWKKRDCIGRLKSSLLLEGVISEKECIEMDKNVHEMIEEAWIKAEASPHPKATDLLDFVYAKGRG